MEFLKEAAIMHTIDHEHIVRLYGVVLDTNSLMLVCAAIRCFCFIFQIHYIAFASGDRTSSVALFIGVPKRTSPTTKFSCAFFMRFFHSDM